MQLVDIDHITIPVSDLERSRRFYVEILGLVELPRPEYLSPGAWLAGKTGRPRINLTTRLPLRPGRGDRLEPTERHIGFLVDDYEAARTLLVSKGVRVLERQHRPDTPRELFFLDPDEHLLEIRSGPWLG